MIKENGGGELRSFTGRSFRECVTQVTSGVWHVLGVGHSNAVFIEGDKGVILIDTLDTLERGRKLLEIIKQNTGKTVGTVIYTHGHPDHRGGAGAFLESEPEIIAFAGKNPVLERTQQLCEIQNLRGNRQFGYSLTDEEAISQGIGIREGITRGELRAFVPPSTVYQEDRVSREIDGIRLELLRLPGESEDQIMIWLPDREVLCCGDNYYGCWPNLYAIRGGQYRDIAAWIHSLDTILAFEARYLLPGHTAALAGKKQVKEVLGNFRGAIDSILTQTLKGMNQGKSMDELAAEVCLPPEYADLPYLGEYYGCVDWTVRAVYTAYLGWFDGNPTRLHPLPPAMHAEKTVRLMGGPKAVRAAAAEAMTAGEYQWCMELCDLLLSYDRQDQSALIQKADALERLAEYETSANGRHYYLTCAHEIRDGVKKNG